VLSVTATFAPYLAASTLGVALEWSGQLSSGGIVALVAMTAMWVWCRSWGSWWKWIWLPIAVTVVLAFVLVNSSVASARAEAQAREAARTAQTCAEWKSQLAAVSAQHEQLVADISDKMAWGRWTPPTAPPRPLTGATNWEKFNGVGYDDVDRYNYYVEHGGPSLREQAEQLQADYSAQCR